MEHFDHVSTDVCSVMQVQFTHMKSWVWRWYIIPKDIM